MKKLTVRAASLLLALSVTCSGIPTFATASGTPRTAVVSAAPQINKTVMISSNSSPQVSKIQTSSYVSTLQAGETRMITSVSGLPVYTGPSAAYERLLTLGPGNQLSVIEIPYSAGWVKVSCGGHGAGWVNAAELTEHSILTAAPQEFVYSGKQAQVLASALTVYAAPAAIYANILTGPGNFSGSVYRGQIVEAIGYTTNGFTKIQYDLNGNVITGYVSSAWVKISDKPANTPKETFKKCYGYSAQIKTEYEAVSIYASPYTDSTILATLQSAQVVTILSESENWYRITLNADDEMLTGYIHRSFADRINALSNLRLNKTEKTLKRHQKYQLILRGTTGMNVKVSWKSSKKKVATVSKRGYVTAKKAGTARITCTVKVGNRTKKLTCKIRVKK